MKLAQIANESQMTFQIRKGEILQFDQSPKRTKTEKYLALDQHFSTHALWFYFFRCLVSMSKAEDNLNFEKNFDFDCVASFASYLNFFRRQT